MRSQFEVAAYWPARLELWALRANESLFTVTGVIALAIIALDLAGRWRTTPEGMVEQGDEAGDSAGPIVLDIGAM